MGSFFFYMDVIGTASLLLDLTYVTPVARTEVGEGEQEEGLPGLVPLAQLIDSIFK